jgi:hypothetical protein
LQDGPGRLIIISPLSFFCSRYQQDVIPSNSSDFHEYSDPSTSTHSAHEGGGGDGYTKGFWFSLLSSLLPCLSTSTRIHVL